MANVTTSRTVGLSRSSGEENFVNSYSFIGGKRFDGL